MPRLLKNDTVRLLESSVESLGLAQLGICMFRRDQLKIEQVRYSSEIGLIGCAVELIMSAILIQALGTKSIYRDYKAGRYKTASEILSDFRNLLKQSSINTSFLTNGILKKEEHFTGILELTNRFQIIITCRANGLHNGFGLSYEIVASLFQDVSNFMKLIGTSSSIKPYLAVIPELVGISIDKKVLIEDLYDRLKKTDSAREQESVLSSLFLILPEIPQNLPEWVSKFESLKIAPKKNDVVFLIDALEKANPVALKKVQDGGDNLNVTIVGRDVPGAIQISAQFLKTEFTQVRDQFYADIATANGRVKTGQLDLPPKQSIYNVFSVGLVEAKILEEKTKLTAHQAWPFIVEAVNVPKGNTTAPFWFLIRNTDDLGQLKACIKKARKSGNKSHQSNMDFVLGGIESIESGLPISIEPDNVGKVINNIAQFTTELERVGKVYAKNGLNGLDSEFTSDFSEFFNETISVGELLGKILLDTTSSITCKKYWVAKLTLIMPEAEDLVILTSILLDEDYTNAHTNVRKTLRAFDFNTHGPKIK